ncbi:YidH family protein [Pseudoxanthomonas sp. 10H]|uniref:YidH family protein n=1 Tax=Pseudoxanthomonas sp. 10H TaxID=3242729 RepID=UPI0035576BF4
MNTQPGKAKTLFSDVSSELASRRTGMAFQRTRLAADRTLMAVIRTSLSLISFGFTIHKVFEGLKESGAIIHAASGRNFGVSLVLLGVVMLVIGIGYHAWFMLALRRQRTGMAGDRLVHAESPFPPSMTLITAVLLLVLGVVAMASMVLHTGPFE